MGVNSNLEGELEWNETLMIVFLDLFSLCTNPEETVVEIWSTQG